MQKTNIKSVILVVVRLCSLILAVLNLDVTSAGAGPRALPERFLV